MRLSSLLVSLILPICAGYYLDEDYVQNVLLRDSKNYYDKRSYYDDNLETKRSYDDHNNSRKKLLELLSNIVEYSKKQGISHEKTQENAGKEKAQSQPQKHNLQMPGVAPKTPDTYLCFGMKMPDQDAYITKFEPLANMKVAHHMLLFSCEEPFKKDVAWSCREMAPVCKTGTQSIKYAWGKNAPSLKMPEKVAFHVGGSSPSKYLVLQVHYLHVDKFKDGKTKDNSGLIFTTTFQKPEYFAGIYLLAAGWPAIPPHKEKFHMDMSCLYQSQQHMKMFPFRFRVHAHKLGAVITAYRVRDGKYTLIGRGDPQRAQAFYKVDNDLDIQDGDNLIGRCTYNSTSRDRDTYIGATHNDEMCNFYIMFFYKSDYGDVNPGCSRSTGSFPYPADSDITLAEVERKASLLAHGFSYKVVDGWPKGGATTGQLSQEKQMPVIGQIAGVEVTKDHVIIFHRAKRVWDATTFDLNNNLSPELRTPIKEDTLVWLDRSTGEFVKSMGEGLFFMPHGITVDTQGNLWLTDVGSHQVFKLTATGKVELVIGEQFVNGDDDKHFCKPTDVAVTKDGEFFVSDGYCNKRVLKFNAKGDEVLMEIHADKKNNLRPMNVVHSLALDHSTGQLYVADRENRLVHAFDTTNNKGQLVWNIPFNEPVYAVAFSEKDNVLHAVTSADVDNSKSIGYTYNVKSKHLVTNWSPKLGFQRPHDLAVSDDDKEIFVSQIGPNKVWKLSSTAQSPRVPSSKSTVVESSKSKRSRP